MKDTLTKTCASLRSGITLTPREAALCLTAFGCAAVACAMTGVVLGMLISPRKSIAIGSHNGNNNGNNNGGPCDPKEKEE